MDFAKIILDSLVLVLLTVGGALVKRAQKSADERDNERWGNLDNKLDQIDKKIDANVAQTNKHAADIGVIKFRLNSLDGKNQD